MKYICLIAGLCLTSCASTGGKATMKGCDISKARSANPYGSVLVQPEATNPHVFPDNSENQTPSEGNIDG